jgi:hypothetical protein
MTPEVQEALDEIASAFPGRRLDVVEDGEGGTFVSLHDVEVGSPYQQSSSWFGFHITHTYPYSDVYPIFVRHDLSRADGKPLGDATSNGTFRGQPAVQISRRANRHNPETDTALLKLQKVLRWLLTRP